jgi:two-component system, LytTR family, response regulator
VASAAYENHFLAMQNPMPLAPIDVLPPAAPADRFLLLSNVGFDVILLKNLLFLHSEGNYTHIYQIGGQHFVSTKPIKEYQSLLPERSFFRSHQSYIVNLEFVLGFKSSENCICLLNGHQVPVAKRKKAEFVEAMQRLALG